MFGSAALEVATGLILVFLLMSLIMTIVQETVQGFLNTRARMLESAVLEILQGNSDMQAAIYNHPLIYALHRGQRAAGEAILPLPKQLPSYIPRETFAAALIDLMNKSKTAESAQLRQAFTSLKTFAGTDAAALRREVEAWYDAAMDRVSGAFKRRSQASLFILGLAAALLFNVNAIVIAQFLAVSPQQRQLVTAIAERTIELRPAPARQPQGGSTTPAAVPGGPPDNAAAPAEAPTNAATPAGAPGNATAPAEPQSNAVVPADPSTPVTDQQVRDLTNQLIETGMPLGWSPASRHWIERGFPDGSVLPSSIAAILAWLLLVAGYLVTAFAVMLGAPFWFDMLNKIMVIRATVKPREKSPDEASEDRGGGRTSGQGA